MSKPAGAGSPLALRKWLSRLSAAWGPLEANAMLREGWCSSALSCTPPRAWGLHLCRSHLLTACYSQLLQTQLGKEMKNHSYIRECAGCKIDWFRSHLFLLGRWKRFSSQIVGELVTGVSGIKGNWENNQKRAFQETLSLDRGIWLHTNYWSLGHNFHALPNCRDSPPNDNI